MRLTYQFNSDQCFSGDFLENRLGLCGVLFQQGQAELALTYAKNAINDIMSFPYYTEKQLLSIELFRRLPQSQLKHEFAHILLNDVRLVSEDHFRRKTWIELSLYYIKNRDAKKAESFMDQYFLSFYQAENQYCESLDRLMEISRQLDPQYLLSWCQRLYQREKENLDGSASYRHIVELFSVIKNLGKLGNELCDRIKDELVADLETLERNEYLEFKEKWDALFGIDAGEIAWQSFESFLKKGDADSYFIYAFCCECLPKMGWNTERWQEIRHYCLQLDHSEKEDKEPESDKALGELTTALYRLNDPIYAMNIVNFALEIAHDLSQKVNSYTLLTLLKTIAKYENKISIDTAIHQLTDIIFQRNELKYCINAIPYLARTDDISMAKAKRKFRLYFDQVLKYQDPVDQIAGLFKILIVTYDMELFDEKYEVADLICECAELISDRDALDIVFSDFSLDIGNRLNEDMSVLERLRQYYPDLGWDDTIYEKKELKKIIQLNKKVYSTPQLNELVRLIEDSREIEWLAKKIIGISA